MPRPLCPFRAKASPRRLGRGTGLRRPANSVAAQHLDPGLVPPGHRRCGLRTLMGRVPGRERRPDLREWCNEQIELVVGRSGRGGELDAVANHTPAVDAVVDVQPEGEKVVDGQPVPTRVLEERFDLDPPAPSQRAKRFGEGLAGVANACAERDRPNAPRCGRTRRSIPPEARRPSQRLQSPRMLRHFAPARVNARRRSAPSDSSIRRPRGSRT